MVMLVIFGLRITAESPVLKIAMNSSLFSGVSLSEILILPQAMVELEGWNSSRNESEAKSLFSAGRVKYEFEIVVSNFQIHNIDQI